MSKELVNKLTQLKSAQALTPDASWKAQTRNSVLAFASESAQRDVVPHKVSVFSILNALPLSNLYFATRGVFVFMLGFGIVAGSLVASASPIPRELLFNVKVAMASATGNTEAKVQLFIDEAAHQSQSLSDIFTDEKPAESKQIKQVTKQVQKIKMQVETASRELETVQQEDAGKASDLAKDISAKTTVISDQLKEVTKEVAEQVATENGEQTAQTDDLIEAAKQVAETRKAVTESSIGALEILTGSDEVVDESIKKIVQDKIGEIIADAEAAQSNAILESQSEQVDKDSDAITTSTSTPAEATQKTASTTPQTSSTSSPAIISVQTDTVLSGSSTVHDLTADIQNLLKGDQLPEAVEKAKILNSFTSEVQAGLVPTPSS